LLGGVGGEDAKGEIAVELGVGESTVFRGKRRGRKTWDERREMEEGNVEILEERESEMQREKR